MRVLAASALALCAAFLAAPSTARAWDLFRRQNPDVEAGNEHLRGDRHEEALEAYDRAARLLPGEAGVALNRGLALLRAGRLDEALEALLRAAEPPAAAPLRADAYYDRGVALMQQAEAHAEENAHEPAQDRFRLAAESFRRSLAAHPGNRDAAWNLELALRRLHEEEEDQEQQEQEQQDQEQQEQEQQDQEQQEQEQEQEQQDQEQQEQEQEQQDQEQQPQNEGEDQQSQDPQQDPQGQDQPSPPEPDSPERQPSGDAEDQEQPASPETLPSEAARILDSLQDGEENLERIRARARALRERRLPTKDW